MCRPGSRHCHKDVVRRMRVHILQPGIFSLELLVFVTYLYIYLTYELQYFWYPIALQVRDVPCFEWKVSHGSGQGFKNPVKANLIFHVDKINAAVPD